jgi:hypothetical protein
LLRLTIVTLLVVRVTDGRLRCDFVYRVRRPVMRWADVPINRQSAVHDAGVQLRRLGQTNGEPD